MSGNNNMQKNALDAGLHTGRIAKFLTSIQYDDIPSEVIERIKLLILDSFGCAIFGCSLPWSKILIDVLCGVDSSNSCTIWGSSSRISAPHAALINGALVQSFELDDVHRAGVLHVGAVTLPALLAAVQSGPDISGKEFLTAAVAGYEIGPRVGLCMGPEHIGQGWHSGATVGVYSAAAAAARVLGLGYMETVHALGIAGTQSSGLMAAQFGSMVKRMHAGRAAQSGYYAAMLAKNGYTGIVDVFENEYGGFCSTFSRSIDRFDLSRLSNQLGSQFETMNIALKFYACVGSNHTTLDAIHSMKAERNFEAADVETIIVYGSRVTVDHVGWEYKPQGPTAAQLNLPYCTAVMLLENDVFVEHFSDDMLDDDVRIELARRVKVLEDPEITARGASSRHMVRVVIFLRDGTKMEAVVEAPKGSENKFATEAEIVDKFRKLTESRIGRSQSDRLIQQVLGLERLPDVKQLTEALGT